MAHAIVRGSNAVLTTNPIVPYLRAHRYQNRLELIAMVAATAATTLSALIRRTARYVAVGTRKKRKPAMMTLYTDSIGKR